MTYPLKNQGGIALVVTLLAVILIMSLVVEFSYGVYIGTGNLYNWRDSQRLSLMARSGIHVSAKMITDALKDADYSYPGVMEFPVENPFEGFKGSIMIRIEDESSRFNVNALVPPNEIIREDEPGSPYNCFKRLLRVLSLNERIADRIVDWIDSDHEARDADSEREAKNGRLASRDEILSIPGISRDDYNTLLPHITVYGTRDNLSININGAEKPVLRCLSEKITDELAQRVIDFRKNNPFQAIGELDNVAGFGGGMDIPAGVITVKGEEFSIQSAADAGGVKRIIETVLNLENSSIEYWKEY
jgi:general secretion pathway protein K